MKFENIKLRNIEYVIKYVPKQRKWSAVDRKNHIIGIQLCGKVEHDFGYQSFTIADGCLYFLNQKDNFDAKTIEQPCAYSVHFTTYEEVETDSFCIKVANPTEIISLIDKIDRQSNLSTKGDNLAASYFYKLCAAFEDMLSKEYSPKDVRLIAAREYMDVHFKEKDCLNKASELCGISRRRFNELFKKLNNITPNKYIINRKINLAKELLKTDEFSVAEISEACGFGDVYYFCKIFKKEVGCTPHSLRKR